MAEWSVRVEAGGGDAFDDAAAESVIDALARHAPAMSYNAAGVAVRFNVEAASAHEAVDTALDILGDACAGLDVFHIEAQTIENLDQELGSAGLPEVVGVTELADLLKVSKQRVSELAHRPGFPNPVAVLASGPVWRTASVRHYVRSWQRRPGRPRKGSGIARRHTPQKE